MYGAVTTSRVDPANIDEAEKIYREKVVPLAKQYGARKLMLMIDRSTGKTVSVAVWESEASARNYETSGQFGEIIALFGDIFIETPKREVFELLVQAE